jgi:hypothetical protein
MARQVEETRVKNAVLIQEAVEKAIGPMAERIATKAVEAARPRIADYPKPPELPAPLQKLIRIQALIRDSHTYWPCEGVQSKDQDFLLKQAHATLEQLIKIIEE